MIKEDGLPIGLGFGLAMNEDAMNHFSAMTEEEKRQVIEAARSVQTKEEMHHLVQDIAKM
ncbi:MAG: hypothetical protein ACI4AD_00585 [Roseburia sp.]